ncbi:putative methyltransferase [Streptococcus sp. BCA20]|uniref:site-specific DNA-methyltransferase n=1 Tax=Streptococcus oralis TaxID=1303 RepID=UPI000F9A7A47|nr:site-specific DNA-methyltransferase [Streptococcus oralis]RSH97874.1 putative methyltransferase [Streptococcus oralis]RSJ39041.1 putative methyltransferase [Streptococcus sp. BCA20]
MTTEQHKGEHTGLDLLKVGSKGVFTENISKIGQLFPEVLTEKRDEYGRLRPAIDFEKLKQFLSEEIVDGHESYEFTWVGKREAIVEAGRPTTKTLRPDLDESVDFDKSENIFITGDNLEVLKILQESYLGKIDMIYIDPPYNTGKDFVYSDKFQKTDEELKEEMDLLDEEGRQVVGLQPNEKSSARYHSDWLNMMYPRLRLARNLLKDNGAIFISIDENEYSNLKQMLDEIFGEGTFIENIVWDKKSSAKGVPPTTMMAGVHEYILVFQKKKDFKFLGEKREESDFSNPDNDPRGLWRNTNIKSTTSSKEFTIIDPETGISYTDTWAFSEKELNRLISERYIIFPKNPNGQVRRKEFMNELQNEHKAIKSSFGLFDGQTNTEYVKKLFGIDKLFSNPKPINLLKYLISVTLPKDSSIILDFFGGSGTTADAVMQLNAEDGGNRKFILCTLDEAAAEKSAAKEAGYETIDQISRERIRRAAAKLQEEHPELVGKQDFGFKAYKLDSSNFKDVSSRPDQFIQGELFDSVSNIKEGRSGLDLLFQVMLTWGMELSLEIDLKNVAGAEVFDVDQGSLMACFDDDVSEEVIRHIAQAQPLRAVFRDSSFANSADKINVSEIFKELSPNTKVKVV